MRIYLKYLLIISMISTISNAEVVKTYFKTGELKAVTSYIDGTNSEKKEGIKNGIEKVYYMIGKVANEVNYVNGKRDGKLTWYDKKGLLLATIHYSMGKLNGLETSYHANGKVKHTVNFVNDKKEGEQKEFFNNAQLAQIVFYIHGKKNGIQKEYRTDGKLYTQVRYKNNYREGNQEWYDKNGKVTKTIFYKMDRPINIMKKIQNKNGDNIKIKNIDFSPQKMRD